MSGYSALLSKLVEAAPTKSYEKGAPFRCSNCFEHLEDHTPEKLCLFAPTVFSSMDPDEYEAWYTALPATKWDAVGAAGAEYIKDALSQSSFASTIMKAYQLTPEELEQLRDEKNKEQL